MRKYLVNLLILPILRISICLNVFMISNYQSDCSNIDSRWKADVLYKMWHRSLDWDWDWIVYWWNSELEWTLVVPSPSNVASGVPTDDTVWTADFELTWVMTALWVINEWVQKASKFIPHTTNL